MTQAGVESRCELVDDDFFMAVLAEGDAYLLSYVLHDWDDERCVAILANCPRAIAVSGTLLVIELVLPEGNEPLFCKWLDLHMLVRWPVVVNGQVMSTERCCNSGASY